MTRTTLRRGLFFLLVMSAFPLAAVGQQKSLFRKVDPFGQRLSTSQGVLVPALVGQPEDEARVRLHKAELLPGGVTYEPSTSPEGTVIRQSIGAGNRVPAGTPVAMVIARGRPEVEVPNLIGASLGSAREALSGVGLETGGLRYGKFDGTAGTVMGQLPGAGTRVSPGSQVALTLVLPDLAPGLVSEPSRPKEGEEVRFTIVPPAEHPVSSRLKYRIDFGDGSVSDWSGTTRVTHAYSKGGTFPAVASSMLSQSATWDAAPVQVAVLGALPVGWFAAGLAGLALLGAGVRYARKVWEPKTLPNREITARLIADPGAQTVRSVHGAADLPTIGLRLRRGASITTVIPRGTPKAPLDEGRTHGERQEHV